MSSTRLTILAAGCLFTLAAKAQAQVSFSIGPQVGYNLTSVSYDMVTGSSPYATYSYETSSHSGFAAGLKASVNLPHFAFQPAILFSQQGYKFSDNYNSLGSYTSVGTQSILANRLAIPLNFVYTQQADGQGFQLFSGPYISFLLGGSYQNNTVVTPASGASKTYSQEGDVKAGDTYSESPNDTNYYQRNLDAGLQAGLGYQFKTILLQAGYSWGLRNIGAAYPASSLNGSSPVLKSRAFTVSLAYLFTSKI